MAHVSSQHQCAAQIKSSHLSCNMLSSPQTWVKTCVDITVTHGWHNHQFTLPLILIIDKCINRVDTSKWFSLGSYCVESPQYYHGCQTTCQPFHGTLLAWLKTPHPDTTNQMSRENTKVLPWWEVVTKRTTQFSSPQLSITCTKLVGQTVITLFRKKDALCTYVGFDTTGRYHKVLNISLQSNGSWIYNAIGSPIGIMTQTSRRKRSPFGGTTMRLSR